MGDYRCRRRKVDDFHRNRCVSKVLEMSVEENVKTILLLLATGEQRAQQRLQPLRPNIAGQIDEQFREAQRDIDAGWEVVRPKDVEKSKKRQRTVIGR